jgi:hypothetical protein
VHLWPEWKLSQNGNGLLAGQHMIRSLMAAHMYPSLVFCMGKDLVLSSSEALFFSETMLEEMANGKWDECPGPGKWVYLHSASDIRTITVLVFP